MISSRYSKWLFFDDFLLSKQFKKRSAIEEFSIPLV